MLVTTVLDVGAAVRAARRARGQTQADFARQVGVRPAWVGRLERGHPRLEVSLVLEAVAAAGLALSLESRPPDSRSNDVLNRLLTDLTLDANDLDNKREGQ
jgi:HTH-type transcriptional regulator / antitoxin HipB